MKQLIWAMGRLSKNWAALVAHWEEIEQCYLTEAKDGWGYIRAPKTYELMEQIQRNISV
jgi:hypothetical protein